jgi:hypothetical protein
MVFVLATFNACVWVDLNDKGKNVQVLTQGDAGRCTKIGHVSSTTTSNVAGIPRDEESLNNELTRLARNYAGDMGGNAIVAIGVPKEGQQSFNVYRCSSSSRR